MTEHLKPCPLCGAAGRHYYTQKAPSIVSCSTHEVPGGMCIMSFVHEAVWEALPRRDDVDAAMLRALIAQGWAVAVALYCEPYGDSQSFEAGVNDQYQRLVAYDVASLPSPADLLRAMRGGP